MPTNKRAAAPADDAEQGRRPLERTKRLRQRAAWTYYVEEMTQSDIA